MSEDVTTTIPWYVSFFGEGYFDIYGAMLSDERTARQIEGIEKLLNLRPGGHILDLACGHGRHAIPLAEHGYRVTGQDLSEIFLNRARADATARGVTVNWVHADMQEIPYVDEFDAIINIFTAFGYLEGDAEDQRVLHQVHKALRPGGRFLLELMHRDALVRGFQPFGVSRREDGLLVTEERRFDQRTGRNSVWVTLIYPDGHRAELAHETRIYTPDGARGNARQVSARGLSHPRWIGWQPAYAGQPPPGRYRSKTGAAPRHVGDTSTEMNEPEGQEDPSLT